MRLDTCVMDLSAALRAAAEVVRPAAAARRVRISLPARLAGPWVLGDPKRLQQAFWHLLSNAVKFSLPGQRVRATVRQRRGAVAVEVADSGAGIPREFIAKVFTPFSQAERSLTREHGGLGAGLAIVKRVAELHGGSIAVFSRGLGRGTRFTLELPATRRSR
jgi:signal transduction histidine kinase